MAIEIVDLPINSMVIVHSYVSLPEGRIFSKPEAAIDNLPGILKILFLIFFVFSYSEEPAPQLEHAWGSGQPTMKKAGANSVDVLEHHWNMQSLLLKHNNE